MEFRKEIVRPATYTYINPSTGLPERLTVTPETVKHYHDQGAAMIASGLSIPVPLEHQPDAKPMTGAERAAANLRNLAGETKRYEIASVDEVNEKGETVKKDALFAVVDITDEAIAGKIKDKTLKWTSPWIHSFVDGSGKAWDNVISHIALTATPRITKQTPFESISAAMSLVVGLTDKKIEDIARKGFALTPVGRLSHRKGKLAPTFPKAFSLMTGIPLALDELDEELDDETDDDAGADTGADAGDSDAAPAADVPDLNDNQVAGDEEDIAIYDLLADLLRMVGVKLPSGTNKATFLKGLYKGLMEWVKANMNDKDDDALDQDLGIMKDQNAGAKNPVIQESPPMYMSIEEINLKVKDPAQRKIFMSMLSLHQENEKNRQQADSMKKHILDEATRRRASRIETIAKRLPADKRDRFVKTVTAPSAALSLVDGQVVDPVSDLIQLSEDLAMALTGMDDVKELEHPSRGSEYNANKFEKSGFLPVRT